MVHVPARVSILLTRATATPGLFEGVVVPPGGPVPDAKSAPTCYLLNLAEPTRPGPSPPTAVTASRLPQRADDGLPVYGGVLPAAPQT